MRSERWNEILDAAAAQAIEECGDTPTIQQIARRAAELAAEWAVEASADEDSVQRSD